MAVEPQHMYSNEAEKDNWDIYDDFKLKKTLWFPRFMKKYFSIVRVNIGGLRALRHTRTIVGKRALCNCEKSV